MKTHFHSNILIISSLLMLFASNVIRSQVVTTIWNSTEERITDALILDDQGNLYGADYNGDAVYVLSPSGEISTFVDGLNTPNGLAFDSQGNLFVCDNIANRIYTIDPLGNFIDTVIVSSPSGIIKELDSDTMIFTQYSSHRLNKLSPDGIIIQTHAGGDLNGPVGLAYDSEGELYVGNFNDREIYRVNGSELEYVAKVPGPSGGRLGFIAYGGGMLWGTSFQGDEIYQIEPNYIDSVLLYSGSTQGNVDGPIAEATFSDPNGIITTASADSIYISQYPGGQIRLISPNASGIEEFESSIARIFPNPVVESFQVRSEEAFDRIEVFDILGNIVAEYSWSDDVYQKWIDMPSLKKGIYFLRIGVGNRMIAAQKFIKH